MNQGMKSVSEKTQIEKKKEIGKSNIQDKIRMIGYIKFILNVRISMFSDHVKILYHKFEMSCIDLKLR